MTPGNIVGMAVVKGLEVIALTDHNSCKNCEPLLTLAKEYGILAIPGMELCTVEEVHVLCLFEDLKHAMDFDSYVYRHLLPLPNREDIFGRQLLCNAKDEYTGKVDNLLIHATDIGFDKVYELMKDFHGLMIPAHIDKTSNSLLSNLGFIPPDSLFRCVEVKDMKKREALENTNPYLKQCRIISDSDAHQLGDINEPIHYIEVEERSVMGILKALGKP